MFGMGRTFQNQQPNRRGAFVSWHWLTIVSLIIIAVAAGILIANKLRRSEVDRGTRALIDAFSKTRWIEPRLSGGFKGGELRSREDAPKVNTDAIERARGVIEDAVARGDPGAQLAYARLLLSVGEKLPQALKYLHVLVTSSPNSAEAHNDLGVCLMQQGKVEDAIGEFDAAFESNIDMPEALFNRALCYSRLRLRVDAEGDLNRLLDIERDKGWRAEATRRRDELAAPVGSSRPDVETIRDLTTALSDDSNQAREIVDRNYEAVRRHFFFELAPKYLRAANAGIDAEAESALARMEKIGSLAVETKGDHDIADTAKRLRAVSVQERPKELKLLEDYQAALGFFSTRKYDEARAALEHLEGEIGQPGDSLLLAKVRYAIAQALNRSRHFTASARILDDLLPLMKMRGWRYHQAQALDLIGLDYSRLGQDSKALTHFQESYDLFQAMREPVAFPLQYAGTTYWHLGNFDQALEHFRTSTDVFLEEGKRPGDLAYNYLNVADIYRLLDKKRLALLFADEALRYSTKANDLNRIAQATSFEAVEHASVAQLEVAEGEINKCVQLLDKIGPADRAYTAPLVLVRAGEVALERDDVPAAIQRYTDAELLTSKAEGDPILHVNALRGRADAYTRAGNADLARRDLDKAIGIIERYRKNLNERLHRIDFLAASNGVFDQMISLDASEPGRATGAFETSERARARSLLDEFAPANQPEMEPYRLVDIRAALPETLAVLAYSLTSTRMHVFLITRKGLEIATSPATDAELAQLINEYLSDVKNNVPPDEKSRTLYKLLLEPVRNRLNGITELCIVPDKSMQLLPISALKDTTNRYVIESFSLIYAPSVSVFIRCFKEATKAARGEERLLAVGNPKFDRDQFKGLPDLIDSIPEAEGAARYYDDPVVLTGEDAAEPAVRQTLKDCTVAHVASHCLVDQQSPWLSCLLLAPGKSVDHTEADNIAGGAASTERNSASDRSKDLSSFVSLQPKTPVDDPSDGLLYLNEVYNLKLPSAKLVLLSACETGLGRYYGGEGIVSLIHPFLAVRVSTVVASLWPVESRATSELMIDFHKERRTLNLRAAAALRSAQLKMIQSGDFAHPYYWASFIVVGGDY